jgi:hypothetical protein
MLLGGDAMNGEDAFTVPTVNGIPSDGRDRYPVQNVSWEDATAYAGWLSSVSRARYRLPTEAEWESVARSFASGNRDGYWTWTVRTDIRSRCESNNIHWQTDLVECVTWNGPIPIPDANPDYVVNMIGNVAEWTADCYRPDYTDAPVDGSAVSGWRCPERVFRGGWWRSPFQFARPAFRAHAKPDYRDYSIGLRVVRELSDQEIAKLVNGAREAGAGDILFAFWMPDGKNVDSANEQRLKDWMTQNNISTAPGSIMMFLRGEEFADARVQAVSDLNLSNK